MEDQITIAEEDQVHRQIDRDFQKSHITKSNCMEPRSMFRWRDPWIIFKVHRKEIVR
jgi:hypothetical protein